MVTNMHQEHQNKLVKLVESGFFTTNSEVFSVFYGTRFQNKYYPRQLNRLEASFRVVGCANTPLTQLEFSLGDKKVKVTFETYYC